jgi:NDP-sugar pyrophosphorylase family protein
MAHKDLADIAAVILAGGLGNRLRPCVGDQPKVLAEIRGRPFSAYLLDQLADAGVQRVVFCTGYMGERVKAAFGKSYHSMRLFYSCESSPLGTAGALRLALPMFGSDSVLVMNGDSFLDIDLSAFLAWHYVHRVKAAMALVGVTDTGRYGCVDVDARGVVLGFQEKSSTIRPGWINAGIYLIQRSLLLTIPETGAVSLETEMLPSWIGRDLYAYKSEGSFLDIGTPEAYAMGERFFSLRLSTPGLCGSSRQGERDGEKEDR